MWAEQVGLELEMVQRGANKYRARVADARERGEMTRLRTYHHQLEEMVPEVAKFIRAWIVKCEHQHRTRGGTFPIAYPRLVNMDAHVLAFIAVRTILDSAGLNKMGLLGVARSIGNEVEYQARMDAWMQNDPDKLYEVKSMLHRQHATTAHVRRVNINRFNALMRETVQWMDWGMDERRHIGLRLIDVVITATRLFAVEADPIHSTRDSDDSSHLARRGSPRKRITAQYVLTVHEDLLEALTNGIDADETRQPMYLPTLMPPKQWQGMRGGGYYTPILRTPTLIRFHADNEEVRGEAIEEYNSLEMPRVYSALNYIQEVPWMVNRRVFAVAMKIWDQDLGIAAIPRRDPIALPPKPGLKWPEWHNPGPIMKARFERDWAENHPEELKAWKRAAAVTYGENARRVSKAQSVRTTLAIAEKFIQREFYFPHMLDFRGRMYPIPGYLQPQGNDLARGLLTFAKGKEVGEDGADWLAIHLANHFGFDKVHFQERIDWVKDNEQVWRAIAEDPIKNRNLWLPETGKKHFWQGLAAVYEWVRYLDEGPTMVSSLPIHVDGTCNGIQHLSAMMRDPVGAESVNLIPGEKPRDIYADVAAFMQERFEGIMEAGGKPASYAKLWLHDTFGGTIPRDFTKNPVMVLPYGGTRESYYGSVMKWLREKVPKGVIMQMMAKSPEERSEVVRKVVPWIVDHMWDCVNKLVVQGKLCMEWLKKAAGVVADTGQPIVWKTPSGFVVRHFYGRLKERSVETLIDGKRIQMKDRERTPVLSKREQLQGISPNFVHSMDACANMETIIGMALHNDQPPVTSIHDAYGTTAGSMWTMFGIVRHAFVWVHRNDVLEDFRKTCVSMYRDHLLAEDQHTNFAKAWAAAEDIVPRVPDRGVLDVGLVAGSDYFFA